MTLNAKIGGFNGFFGDFGLRYTFQERIAPKSIETTVEKLHTKFSALNIDFDGLSFDYLGSGKSAHEGIEERYSRKSRYITVVSQSFVKMVADRQACCLSQQALVTSFSFVSTSMTLKDPELPKYVVFIDFCDIRLQRTLQE